VEDVVKRIRNEIILYDTAHPDFMKTVFKDNVWNGLAEKVNIQRW
jgi:hypothetical protein